jgi:hypothetical protein
MLISNFLLTVSENLAIRAREEPPKIISSTYIWTKRMSVPYLSRNKVLSTEPILKPFSSKKAFNAHTRLSGLVSNHTRLCGV